MIRDLRHRHRRPKPGVDDRCRGPGIRKHVPSHLLHSFGWQGAPASRRQRPPASAAPPESAKPAWLRPFQQRPSLLAAGVASLRPHRRKSASSSPSGEAKACVARPSPQLAKMQSIQINCCCLPSLRFRPANPLPWAGSRLPQPARLAPSFCRCAPRPLPADQTVARHPVAGRRWRGVVEP
jgi:hypothetical protein